MLDYKKIFAENPFSMTQRDKERWYYKYQKELTFYHYKNCIEYKKVADRIFGGINNSKKLSDLPFVPVYLFKDFDLNSKNNQNSSKILTSSGTTGTKTSRIYLDRKTSLLQSRALSTIFSNILNERKSTIFFVDTPNVILGLDALSARGTAIKGFSQLVKKSIFLLDEKFDLKIEKLTKFLKQNPNEQFIIFGFTSFLWTYLIQKMQADKIKLSKNNGILIHGGGWKKMNDQAVDRHVFNEHIKDIIGVNSIHNYYGMVEQAGSVFLECEFGFFHTSIFSEIFIRDNNLKLSPIKQNGLIQTLSLLPLSYPGHNILTEDIGALEGIDDCSCGRKGKYFSIKGRVPGTELRGCSDVY